MNQDEKKCPLTKMTCYGDRCGLWSASSEMCALLVLAVACRDIKQELEYRL